MAEKDSIFAPDISVVAKGLEGKTILIYGRNGLGKSLQSSRMDKPFFFACESGLGALSGVAHKRINDWRHFKQYIREFTDPSTIAKAKEMYHTIVIDEVYAASLFCQKFVCDTYGDGCISLGANENSKINLYQIYERVFWEQIQKLVGNGYTVVFIAHEQSDPKTGYITPKGDKRCISPIIDNCDVVVYLKSNGVDENGNVIPSSAYFVQTNEFFARSRYTHMVPMIQEFTAENLEKAITDGIVAEEESSGVKAVSYAEQQEMYKTETLDFDSVMNEVQEWGSKLAQVNMDRLTEIVEATLGPGKKVSNCTKKQVESVAIILDDIKSACKELGVK